MLNRPKGFVIVLMLLTITSLAGFALGRSYNAGQQYFCSYCEQLQRFERIRAQHLHDSLYRSWNFDFLESENRIIYTTEISGDASFVEGVELLFGPNVDTALGRGIAGFPFVQIAHYENVNYDEEIMQIVIELLFDNTEEFSRFYSLMSEGSTTTLLRVRYKLEGAFSIFYH